MSAARRLAAAVLALLALFRPALGVGADGGRLGGVLVAADGATAAGFTVHLIDGVGHEVASAEVGADGVYAFDHVPAGRYALGIGNPAGQRAPVATPAIVVTPGATVRRDLLLVGADAAARDRALSVDPSLGRWWSGLTTPAKAWVVLAVLVAGWFLYDWLSDDDEGEVPVSPV